MPYPRDVVPWDKATVRALAAGNPAAIRWWRETQQRAADDPSLSVEADYVMESRSGPPPMAEWRVCPGCGHSKALRAGETLCPVCAERGMLPEPSGRLAGGARSLRYEPGPAEQRALGMRAGGHGRMDGNAALDYLDHLDELERQQRGMELYDDYEQVCLRHVPRPS